MTTTGGGGRTLTCRRCARPQVGHTTLTYSSKIHITFYLELSSAIIKRMVMIVLSAFIERFFGPMSPLKVLYKGHYYPSEHT